MKTLLERFYANAVARRDDGCWEWSGRRDKTGYGRMRVAGYALLAHRLAWELLRGSIPRGMWVLHRCDNPPCVNPSHLFLGSNQDNIADMASKNRRSGERHAMASLSDERVMDIRRRAKAGEKQIDLAVEHNVSAATVSMIVSGKRWSHLPMP